MESKNKTGKGWKILAIVLLVILVLENAFILWGVSLVNKDTANEKECMLNICQDYSSYYYNVDQQMCSCYENKEVKYQKYLP